MMYKYSNLLQFLPQTNFTKQNGKVSITFQNGDSFIDKTRRRSIKIKQLISHRTTQIQNELTQQKKPKEKVNEQKIKKLLIQPNFDNQLAKQRIKKITSYVVRKKQQRIKNRKIQLKPARTMDIKYHKQKYTYQSQRISPLQRSKFRSITQPSQLTFKTHQPFKLKKNSLKLQIQDQSPNSSITKKDIKNTKSNKQMRTPFAITIHNNFYNSSFNIKIKQQSKTHQQKQDRTLAPLVRVIMPKYSKKQTKIQPLFLTNKKKQRYFSSIPTKNSISFLRSKTDQFIQNELCGWQLLSDDQNEQQYNN